MTLPDRVRSQGRCFIANVPVQTPMHSHSPVDCCSRRILRCPLRRRSHAAITSTQPRTHSNLRQHEPVLGPEPSHRPRTRIIRSAIQGPDQHKPNIAHALIDFAGHWDTCPPGYLSASEIDAGQVPLVLEGTESLSGMLSVRAVGLTFDRLRWANEGEQAGSWAIDSSLY